MIATICSGVSTKRTTDRRSCPAPDHVRTERCSSRDRPRRSVGTDESTDTEAGGAGGAEGGIWGVKVGRKLVTSATLVVTGALLVTRSY